ncbi:hypothetical protein CVT24_000547 [Panaeolus cyanescens]|uniref:Uncharacterized protein n=1 Tax=Panaeolus cyanescens TaxID=181874 RepID=A0A409V8H3_9AGAR|nr:hypothetical protein CVT24_000547 [Panaeolus cyanescens]
MDIDTESEYLSSWFKTPEKPHPFKLVRHISNKSAKFSFQSSAIFPWKEESLKVLWNGDVLASELHPPGKWKEIVDKYWDMVAVGSQDALFIFHTHKPLPPVVVQLAVTSIAVHPTVPEIFCSTSRDFTTRVYNLMLQDEDPKKRAKKPSTNPHWPPNTTPSLAGAPHGLRLSPREIEGVGVGRCIGVLFGGRSGGHQAAVMSAAFHPTHPLIATCGMDRAVKIWFVRFPQSRNEAEQLVCEDKPLFSTQRIHKARVLSITWLLQDVLVTHSAPAIMKERSGENQPTYHEAGELTVWQWLGFDRFFPAKFQHVRQQMLRGCASDYQESSSFKVMATYAFPNPDSQYVAPSMSVFQYELPERDDATNKPYGHDPLGLILYPNSQHIDIVNIALLKPRAVPHYIPGKDGDAEFAEDQEEDDGSGPAFNPRNGMVPPHLQGWRLRLPPPDYGQPMGSRNKPLRPMTMEQSDGRNPVMLPDCSDDEGDNVPPQNRNPKLLSCSMGVDGQMLVGVGTKGNLWVWTYDASLEVTR